MDVAGGVGVEVVFEDGFGLWDGEPLVVELAHKFLISFLPHHHHHDKMTRKIILIQAGVILMLLLYD